MKELIFNQREIPADKWRYGLRPSAATGCGWVAAYNALQLLGVDARPEELIYTLKRMLPLINGNMGTFILSITSFFRRKGYKTGLVWKKGRFDSAAQSSAVCILFFCWRRKFRFGSHYAALQYRNGHFIGCNTFISSHGPDDYGPSLTAFLKRQGFFLPVLILIDPQGAIPTKTQEA